MLLPSTVQILCMTWYREVNMCRILMHLVSRINRKEEYCLSLAWILTSRYQSIVDDRTKIDKHKLYGKYDGIIHTELSQCTVNESTSWVSLKSSEVNNCSWKIRALLISYFWSSSCCQTCFPTIIRPILVFWKLVPKIKLDSPELNCSVIFSLYFLTVSKKIDDFLRDLVRRETERILLVQYQSTFFHSLFCGFASAFDLAATTLTLDCDACSSRRSARTSVLL